MGDFRAASAHIFRADGTRLAHAKEKPKPPAGIEPATCRLSTPRGVDAPDTRAVCGNEQKHEAVDHGKLPLIHDREERFRAVCHPIGCRHLAAGNEGCPARQEPGRNEGARYQLDRPGTVNDKRRGSGRHRCRDTEQLGEPVTKKEQAHDDAHQRVGLRAIGLHELGHI